MNDFRSDRFDFLALMEMKMKEKGEGGRYVVKCVYKEVEKKAIKEVVVLMSDVWHKSLENFVTFKKLVVKFTFSKDGWL